MMPRPEAGRVTTLGRPADGYKPSHTDRRRQVSCSAGLGGALFKGWLLEAS
jgi:hypothetical protein